MGNIRFISLFIAYVLVYSLLISLINVQAEVEGESALSYGRKTQKAWEDGIIRSPIDMKDEEVAKEEDDAGFSYDPNAPDGPQHWGYLDPNWRTCGTGKSQSPISIADNSVVIWPKPGNLTRRYKPASARLQYRSRYIEVEWTADAGGIIINGREFKLEGCHWHVPAEHTINGVRYNMEMHIDHINSQNENAVVAILFRLGEPDPFLEMLAPYLSLADHRGTDLGVVNPYDIGFKGQKYYGYTGSLTTPPCTENVTWAILKTVKTVSPEQIRQLLDAMNDQGTGNARPIQPLNGRKVYLFKQRSWVESS